MRRLGLWVISDTRHMTRSSKARRRDIERAQQLLQPPISPSRLLRSALILLGVGILALLVYLLTSEETLP